MKVSQTTVVILWGHSLSSASEVQCDSGHHQPVPHLQFFRDIQHDNKFLPKIIAGSLLRKTYGSPLARRRLYMFFFRKDILKKEARTQDQLFKMMEENLKKMHMKESHQWYLDFYRMNPQKSQNMNQYH